MLLDEQQSLKDAQATWGGTVGVLSIGLAFNPLVVALPLAVGAISIAVLKRKQNAVERILADPPRFDYETSTRARRRRYISGVLGDDQLAVAIDQAALATLRAAAYLEASVRADERSQGARVAGRIDLVDWHLEEARHLFEIGKKWSGEMSVSLNVLAVTWAAFAVDSELDDAPLPAEISEGSMPPQALESLGQAGLVVSDLDLSIGRPEETRVVLAPGRSTVGDIALDSATTTRALAWSAGKIAAGARVLPQRAFSRTRRRPLRRSIASHRKRGRAVTWTRRSGACFRLPSEARSMPCSISVRSLTNKEIDREPGSGWIEQPK